MPKKIILSTTNDISTDNRVHKVAMLLLLRMQIRSVVRWEGMTTAWWMETMDCGRGTSAHLIIGKPKGSR